MNTVGKIIRIEWDQETDEMQIVMEITDDAFKRRVLHGRDFQDVLNINGKDVICVASKSKRVCVPSKSKKQ